MTDLQLKNVAIYVAIGISIFLADGLSKAIGAGTIPGFADGQTFASVRLGIASLLTLLVTAGGIWLAAHRPRVGSEELAAAVDQRRKTGQSRKSMAIRTAGTQAVPNDPDEVAHKVADILEARMKAAPAKAREDDP